MPAQPQPPGSEREQTDESLRAERDRVDHALDDVLAAIEETADNVIVRAREKADEVLAASRAETDRLANTSDAHAHARLERSRLQEDRTVREARADADEVTRLERSEYAELLAAEREETDQYLMSERSRSDDALARRDEFLGVVSHDLRNLLGTMVGFAALIAKEVLEDHHVERVLHRAQRIQRSGARMNRLIGDLVDVSSIEAGMLRVTLEVGDPTSLVTEAVNNFVTQAKEQGVTVAAEIAPVAFPVAFDAARILQVLTNLLVNAIKFTPPRGRVTVRLESIAEELRITVSDTGCGIPAEKLDAIFDKYTQIASNDRRGMGLGLYISKCIVQAHGGRLWAESSDGRGSTFSFTLPAVLERPACGERG
jgi:signal transduction histidine kinase